jgi:hypothetical protein
VRLPAFLQRTGGSTRRRPCACPTSCPGFSYRGKGRRGHRQYSYWLETAGDLTPRPPLDGRSASTLPFLALIHRVRTAISSSAIRPSRSWPRLIAGFGASYRNGGCAPASSPTGKLRKSSGDVAREIAPRCTFVDT